MITRILAAASGIFLLALFAQLLLWNCFKIKQQMKLLFIIFFPCPLVALCVGYGFSILSLKEVFMSGAFHCLISSAYIQSYPLFCRVIPSFRILMFVEKSTNVPVTSELIVDHVLRDDLVDSLVEDLIADKLIVQERNQVYLTRGGKLLQSIFTRYRRWLNLQTGEG